MASPVLLHIDDQVATITLNRPKRLNALDEDLLTEFYDVVLQLSWDDEIRAIVITGAGRAFCAGGDLKSLATADASIGAAFHRLAGVFHQSISELRRANKVVIAAINGPAAGGGFSLACACDLRVMSTDAFIQVAYISNGLSIDGGGSWTLPRLVGYGKALELALTDHPVQADEAVQIGLANWAVEPAMLLPFAQQKGEEFAKLPPMGIGRTKNLMNHGFDRELEIQLEEERRHLAAAADSPDGREGVAAFLEKRDPKFNG